MLHAIELNLREALGVQGAQGCIAVHTPLQPHHFTPHMELLLLLFMYLFIYFKEEPIWCLSLAILWKKWQINIQFHKFSVNEDLSKGLKDIDGTFWSTLLQEACML